MVYPKALENLIENLKKLPTIGEKSAERLALSIFGLSKEDNVNLSTAITDAHLLQNCVICGSLSQEDECDVCTSEYRDKNLICVVEDYKSVFMFEKLGNYKGVYQVLDGLISPMDGINPDDINISQLVTRTKSIDGEVELIIALKPTLEGEATTMYITKILKEKNIKISRLSYGIPMGAEIDYLDALTLERALLDRKDLL